MYNLQFIKTFRSNILYSCKVYFLLSIVIIYISSCLGFQSSSLHPTIFLQQQRHEQQPTEITRFDASSYTYSSGVLRSRLKFSERVNEEGDLKISENDSKILTDSEVTTQPSSPTEKIISKLTTTSISKFPVPESSYGEATQRLGVSSKPTVWTEFSRIAASQGEENICNLGQGFPDWSPPPFAIESLVTAAANPANHQYTRPAGHPNLVKQLARRYSMHFKNRVIDPFTEVAVTVGASQALYLTLQSLIQPGDEVILFEPFFDLYVNQVKLAGGTPVFVPLDYVPYGPDQPGGTWVLNPETLKQKVSSQRTKAIILNSPHNPTGKIFTRAEMEYIAESLEFAHPDCIVLSDEVYKYIVHAPESNDVEESTLHCRGHVHFASLPGMWDKTITISSAGKTFSATGWQIGWCIGPQPLIARVHQLLPYVQFCASTVMQEALAQTLTRADEPYEGYESYYDYLRNMYLKKRNLLTAALQTAGFIVPDYSLTPGGGFFIFAQMGADIINCIPPERINVPNIAAPGGTARLDWAMCQWLAEEKGLLCIPSSPFFSETSAMKGVSDPFIRIAFCKTDATIERAATILATLRNEQPYQPQNMILTDAAVGIVKNTTEVKISQTTI